MRRPRRVIIATCAAAWVAGASPARAQTVAGGRFEAGLGVTWTGGTSIGAADATETAPSGRLTLFSTSTQMSAAAGLDARVAVRLTSRFALEASSSYSRPTLRTAISGDLENGAAITATDALRQITVDGAVVMNLLGEQRVRRPAPFVVGGAGYVRQLHEGDTLAVDGERYFAGGGITLLLMSRPHGLKGAGLRADARVLLQRKGAAFDDRTHASPTATVAAFIRF